MKLKKQNNKKVSESHGIPKWIRNKYFLLSIVLIFLSFPSYDSPLFKLFPLFAWFSLAPLLIYVKGKPLRNVYVTSFLTTLAGAFCAFGWMRSFGSGTPGGEFSVILFLIPCVALLWSGRIVCAEFLSRRNENLRFIIYPSVWIAGDYIQSLGFLAFPWTYWGYSQYPVDPFIQIASVTGVNGVTFLLILGNTLVADIFIRFKNFKFAGLRSVIRGFRYQTAFFVVIAMLFVWGAIRLSYTEPSQGKNLRIAMIQSCISPWEDWIGNRDHYLKELTDISREALKDKPDFMIWSESATLEPIGYHYRKMEMNEFEANVCAFAKYSGIPLLTGEIGVKEVIVRRLAYPQNSAILLNSDGEPVTEYAKIHLAPFGEWFPYERLFPSLRRFISQMGGSDFIPGRDPVIFSHNNMKFGVLICYEGLFFRLSRYYARNDAGFLVNITNDGWSGTYAGHYQHFAASKFRAVENGITYLRSGNTGYTAVIDPLGRVNKSIPILKKGYLIADINNGGRIRTFYTRFGDVFTFGMIGLCVLLIVFSVIRKTKMAART